MTRFYGYAKCATCRKAKVYLHRHGVAFDEIDITTTPPSRATLRLILESGSYRLSDLFNRSGDLYRELRMKDRINTMSDTALLDLLARHGKLIKRPIVTDGVRHTVGFDEALMNRTWLCRG